MSTEKTPVFYQKKKLPECENEKGKCSSRSIIIWIFIAVLFSLLIVLIIQFYVPFDHRISVYEEQPIDLRNIRPRVQDSDEKGQGKTGNLWDFEFLIDPADLCATRYPANSEQYANDVEVKLLMLVPSAVDHLEQRRAIRHTWGSVAEKPLGPMRLGFVLGTTTNRTVDDLVREESSEYKDVIQADFVDSYYYLTTKSVLMLKWVAKRCPHAQYFLKADDDTFVNLAAIANILSREPYISEDKFISGNIQKGEQPPRTTKEEFDTFPDDYPGDEYVPYVSGTAYVMTIPTAIELFDASKEVEPLLPQEDLYLTGLCARHIEAPLFHEPSFMIENLPSPPSWNAFSSLATAHSVTPDVLEQVWEEMTHSVTDSFFKMEVALNSSVLLRKKKSV